MKLTRREKQILPMLNLANSEIAKELNLKETTVRAHIRNLLSKTKFHKRIDLLLYAIKCGRVNVYKVKLQDECFTSLFT